MAIELSTAGVTVNWAAETVAGQRPTSGYQKIYGIKSVPDLNPENSSLDVTDLSDKEYKRYISGLKDVGGTLAFTANHSQQFQDDWDALIETYNTSAATGLGIWCCIIVPGLSKAFYMSIVPQPLGLSAMEVDSVLEIDAYVAPQTILGWETKPTV